MCKKALTEIENRSTSRRLIKSDLFISLLQYHIQNNHIYLIIIINNIFKPHVPSCFESVQIPNES